MVFKNSGDGKKSDLQTHESLMFLGVIKGLAKSVDVASGFNACAAPENIGMAKKHGIGMCRVFYDHGSLGEMYAHAKNFVQKTYGKNDILISLCGPTSGFPPTGREGGLLYAYYAMLEYFPGRVFYLMNDTRLYLRRSFLGARLLRKITCLTQATALGRGFFEQTAKGDTNTFTGYDNIKYIPMESTPLTNRPNVYGTGDGIRGIVARRNKYDLVYPAMHLYTMDEYRFGATLGYMKYNAAHGIKKPVIIGPCDPSDTQRATGPGLDGATFTGTVKYNKIHGILTKSVSQIAICEKSYTDWGLMPNRVYEGVCAGNIVFFDAASFGGELAGRVPPGLIVGSQKDIAGKLNGMSTDAHIRLLEDQRGFFGLDKNKAKDILKEHLTKYLYQWKTC